MPWRFIDSVVRLIEPLKAKKKVITVYEPEPERWIDFKVRRS